MIETKVVLLTEAELNSLVNRVAAEMKDAVVQEVRSTMMEVNQAAAPPAPVKPMTTKEVADFLKVTEATVRNYADAGHLTKIPIGGGRSFRFDRKEVEEFFLK